MAKGKKTLSPLKEFDAGYFMHPDVCKTHLRAKGVKDKQMLILSFAGVNLGKHVGWKLEGGIEK